MLAYLTNWQTDAQYKTPAILFLGHRASTSPRLHDSAPHVMMRTSGVRVFL